MTDGDEEETPDARMGRRKYWSEIDANEKIERMRDVVKVQSRTISVFERLLDELMKHSHAPDGKLLRPIGRMGYASEDAEPRKRGGEEDQVYF